MLLQDGWEFERVIEDLNHRVFFWPGTQNGPNDHGRRHFARYLAERPLLIRVSTPDLIAVNAPLKPEFCRYNSGSPRHSNGKPSPRGSNTFVPAAQFAGTSSDVVELTFRGTVLLPPRWYTGSAPGGPWKSVHADHNNAV
jgi:hypothetical protein